MENDRYMQEAQSQQTSTQQSSTQQASTPGRAFYDQQIAYLEAGNFDGLMTQYHEDAVLVGFEYAIRGSSAIRDHLKVYLSRLGKLKLKSTDNFVETEKSIFFEATIVTDIGEAKVYDVFMLDAGKATYQFTGVIEVNPISFPT
jgi:hypothetical protein